MFSALPLVNPYSCAFHVAGILVGGQGLYHQNVNHYFFYKNIGSKYFLDADSTSSQAYRLAPNPKSSWSRERRGVFTKVPNSHPPASFAPRPPRQRLPTICRQLGGQSQKIKGRRRPAEERRHPAIRTSLPGTRGKTHCFCFFGFNFWQTNNAMTEDEVARAVAALARLAIWLPNGRRIQRKFLQA